MNTPISVTEDRVTVTANDTEANIRASAGFAEAGDEVVDATPTPAKPGVDRDDETGKFKAKPAEPEPAKGDGDPRKSYQAKINQSIAKQREAERRAEALEAELQTYKQPKPAPVQPSQPEPAQSKAAPYLSDVQRYKAMADAPKLDDFVSDDDPYSAYHAALSVFIADKRMDERQQRYTDEQSQRQREERARSAFDLAEQNHPGFHEQFEAASAERLYPQAVLNVLAEHTLRDPQLSAELLHHIVTHPDDAAVLAEQTTPIAAAIEIGRIAAQLSASSGPETDAPQTTAKPLIKPVKPSVMVTESVPLEKLPLSKYMQVENERERKERTAAHR